MIIFLAILYVLFCMGFVIGTLMDNDEIPGVVKVLLTIFAPITAPVFLGTSIGLILIEKLNRA